jgi:signal transduction histidine kinase/ActR/RegA family two-component response regulator
MRHITHAIADIGSLESALSSAEIHSGAEQARSILVQIYSAQTDLSWIQTVVETITKSLPTAIIVGATAEGGIVDGRTLTGQTMIGFTFFNATGLTAIALNCSCEEEHLIGRQISQRIDQEGADVAGVLLLATQQSIDAANLLGGFRKAACNYPIFGGGVGGHAEMNTSLVFSGADCFSHGVVAVVLRSADLHVISHTYLGWRALSKEMTITEVDGMLVKTIDGKPALEVYRRYLDISNDANFFIDALAFPFLLERDQKVLARVPVSADANGALQFVADINEGDKFYVGYGDPDMIILGAANIHQTLHSFEPEAVFLYACNCRRLFMQEDAELETLAFQTVAPTFGFYSYGEFHGQASELQFLNLAMVAVGLREGPPRKTNATQEPPTIAEAAPSSNQNARIVSRKSNYIGAVTAELEELNRKFTQLITERDKVERMKSEFISAVSHELRTPLTSIRGSLALVVGGVVGELPAAFKPLIDIALKNSERLILLVNDILDMEKIEAGKMEFDMQPVDLMPLLEQALEGNRGYGEQFKVSYEIGGGLPDAMVKVDANRLMQVLANLLSNAAKFSPVGGKVTVAATNNGKRIRVAVNDHGSGIPTEFRDRIFQKFAQADSADTRKKGGTGLGLSITKAMVEQMGGSIGFESQPNVLTTFFIEFPVWKEPDISMPALTEAAGKKRVLICGDDHHVTALLRLTLEHAGLASDIASDVEQARQLLAQKSYAALILDLSMSNQHGIALIRELRAAKNPAALPIVVISANALEGRNELSSEAFSLIDWISKPIDQEQLLATIKRLIGVE